MAQTYVVKQNETLNGIAKSMGYKDYVSAGITGYGNNPDLIRPGQTLNISGQPLTSSPVVSSGSSRKEFLGNSVDLTRMLGNFGAGQNQQNQQNQQNGQNNNTNTNQNNNDNATIDTVSDPYTQQLDKLKANSDAATQNLIATIQARRQGRENDVNKEMERYKSGLQLLGIQSGEIETAPEMVMGKVQQAENARVAKLQELDQQEATAMLEAKMAMDEKDFSLLKDRMNYVKELKKERLNTLKDNFDMLKAEQGIADIQAEQIYNQLGSLNSSQKQQFLQGIADRFGIPVGAVVAGVAKVAEAKAKKSKTGTGGGSGTVTTKQATSKVNSLLEAAKGSDGKVDPYYWMQLRTEWLNNGGSTSSFNSNFKHMVNPKSYALVGLEKDKGGDDLDEIN